jgi:hypothetical protein
MIMKRIVAVSLALVSSCAIADGAEYTLYRTGIDVATQEHDEALRVHVATFDAVPLQTTADNTKYNLANCEFAQELFSASQPHYRGSIYTAIKIKYWCEKGRFKK